MSTEQITPESLTEKQKILSKLEAIRKAKGGGDNFDDAVRQLLDILETGRQQLEFDHKFYQEYVKKLVKKYIAGKGGVANKVDAEFILISFGLLERYNGTGLENAWRRFAKGKKESLKENAPTWLVNNDIKSFYRHRSILLEQLAADIDYAIENGKWVSLLNADSPENGLPAKDQPSEKSSGSDGADKVPEPPNETAPPPAGDEPQSEPPAADAPQESLAPQAESPTEDTPHESSDPQQNPPKQSDENVSLPSEADPQQTLSAITTSQESPDPQAEPEEPPPQKKRVIHVRMRKKPLPPILCDKKRRNILLASMGAILLFTILIFISVSLTKNAHPKPEAPTYRVEFSNSNGGTGAILDVQQSDASYDPVTTPLGGMEVQAEDGKEYAIRIRLESPDSNGIDSARVAFRIPTETSNGLTIYCDFAFGGIDSGTPDCRNGYVVLRANNLFHLEYVPGSAKLYNSGIGKTGYTLPDTITKEGTLVGYDKIDGIIPGGDEHAGYAVIRVKVVSDTAYKVTLRTRHQGGQKWQESVEAAIGDRLEIAIKYENTSEIDETQKNVIVRAVLPDGLTYVPGSVWLDEGNTSLYNSNHPDGMTFENDGSIFGSGVNIGHSKPKGYAYVTILVEVVDNGLMPGKNELVCWGQCAVGSTTRQASCSVLVQK